MNEATMKKWVVFGIIVVVLLTGYLSFAYFMITEYGKEDFRDYPYNPAESMDRFIFPEYEELNQTLMKSTLLTGDYLVEHINDDGSWDYEFNASSGKSNGGYNVLRHAGTTYSLALVFRYGRNPDHYNGTIRTLNNLFSRYLDFERKGGREIAIVRSGTYTKLGGPALALLALIEVKRVDPEAGYDRELEGLKNYIVEMEKDNGSLQCYYGKKENDHSDYYPGEALLAMAKYHEMTGDGEVLDVLRNGLQYYNQYFPDYYTAYSPWATEAIAYLHQLEGGEILKEKGYAMANSCRRGQIGPTTRNDPFYIGAFSLSARSNTASRVEAVCDSYLMAMRNNDTYEIERYRSTIDLCAGFLMRLQIDEEDASTLPQPELSKGGVPNTREDLTVRIDNVQHTAVVLIKIMVYQRGPYHI
jgi:hypothetical protein